MAVPEVAEFRDESKGCRPLNCAGAQSCHWGTDNNAMVEDDWYAANNGLGSPRHPVDKDDRPLTFADPLGDVSGGALGKSAKFLATAEEWELLTAFF